MNLPFNLSGRLIWMSTCEVHVKSAACSLSMGQNLSVRLQEVVGSTDTACIQSLSSEETSLLRFLSSCCRNPERTRDKTGVDTPSSNTQ